MSIPISSCLLSKAARGDEAARIRLFSAMRVNAKHGAFSTLPCQCKPKCPAPTDAQVKKLDAQLEEFLATPAPTEKARRIVVLCGSHDRYRNYVRRAAELDKKETLHAYNERGLRALVDILLLVLPAWNHGMSYQEEREVREMLWRGKANYGWTILYLNEKQERGEEPIVP